MQKISWRRGQIVNYIDFFLINVESVHFLQGPSPEFWTYKIGNLGDMMYLWIQLLNMFL